MPARSSERASRRGRRPRSSGVGSSSCKPPSSGVTRLLGRMAGAPGRVVGGEALDLGLRLVLGVAVLFLEDADQPVGPAVDTVEVVVGEVAPHLLDATAKLLPIALKNVGIHACASA